MEEDLKLVLRVDKYRQENKLSIFRACNALGVSESAYQAAKSRYLGTLIPKYQHCGTVDVEEILRKRNLNFDDMGDQ